MNTRSAASAARPRKLLLLLICTLATAASTSAWATADSLGDTGLITTIAYTGDSSSYSGNLRWMVIVGSDAYYNGTNGYCAAYAEFNTAVLALLEQMQVNGVEITPHYKIGTYSKRCLVGWQ